jgi:DNA-binding transcriptional LysR family regulator
VLERYEMEAFLAVADELHFGRAADRLLVSRARVSQTIQKVERRIGAPLFERTSRKVVLTPLGARLYAEVKPLYAGIEGAIARASDTARGVGGVLRLGVMGAMGHMLMDMITLFGERHPDCEVQIREVHFSDPFGDLRSGEIDAAVVWFPVEEPDLSTGPVLIRERNVLAVSTRHPFAGRASVSLEELVDQPVVWVQTDVPAYWLHGHRPLVTPSGRAIGRGPEAATFQEVLAMVGTGQAIAFVSEHVRRFYERPGIVYIDLDDAEPIRWGLIWRTAGELHRVRALLEVANVVATANRITQRPD